MEGYVGGGVLTVNIGTAFTALCVHYGNPSLICPVKTNYQNFSTIMAEHVNGSHEDSTTQAMLSVPQCDLPDTFVPQPFQVSEIIFRHMRIANK